MFVQFTQAKLTPTLEGIDAEEGNPVLLNIESSDVRAIHDQGKYRVITFVQSEFSMQSQEQGNISTGRLTQAVVIDDYHYIVSALGIKGVVGS